MNCKPNEFAFCTDGPNRDRLFHVLRRSPDAEREEGGIWWVCVALQTARDLETNEDAPAGSEGDCADSVLRPIRPGEISEEEIKELYSPNERVPSKEHA